MNKSAINFEEKFGIFNEQWSPKIIAAMNDYHFKLARVEGDFTWHDHRETDEVFIVLEGCLRIDFIGFSVQINRGEMYVVPKGVMHKPFAESECRILLVEPAGTVNTGDAGGEMTVSGDVWI